MESPTLPEFGHVIIAKESSVSVCKLVKNEKEAPKNYGNIDLFVAVLCGALDMVNIFLTDLTESSFAAHACGTKK